MINLILGAPGGGKSYESVVFHVVPALKSGRKVITNLPLNVDEFEALIPGSASLIELKQPTVDNPRPFSRIEDYQSDFKLDSGVGPLFVIDECHFCLPSGSLKSEGTSRDVREWFSMHRHHGADALLITQSYGKVHKDIIDLVQLVYRVRKNVALGSSSSYVRKVQDGIRGEVVNTSVRTYDPKYFGLYKSHTQANGSIKEAFASDIKPIWKHWSFIFAAIILVYSLVNYKDFVFWMPKDKVVKEKKEKTKSDDTQVPVKVVENIVVPPKKHPFLGKQIHLSGYAQSKTKTVVQFKVSYNGFVFADLMGSDIEKMGYSYNVFNECYAVLLHVPTNQSIDVFCDHPRVTGSVSVPSPSVGSSESLKATPIPVKSVVDEGS